MTVREALEKATLLYDAGSVSDRETVRTISDILSRCPERIAFNERMQIHKITIQALTGEIDAGTYLGITLSVAKCNRLLDRELKGI